jgi:hypothetical protein
MVSRIPAAVLGVAAGGLIVVTNAKTILEAVGMAQTPVLLTCAALAGLWISGIVWAVGRHRAGIAVVEEELAPAPA